MPVIDFSAYSPYPLLTGCYDSYRKTEFFQKLSAEILRYKPGQKATFHKYLGHFTPLGMNFFEACVK